ncbi:Detected protein of confused Function [Hibiscus syriacus]|uniref:Detected protein of confused Function n=1 Tax=Hibiscus syriacus TaxID=106335 RepID=A0A6A2YI43_HIBSY|nr:Detected protein of confused Function [Hibiscus syriacus]
MGVSSLELHSENIADTCQLLMERSDNLSEHVIDMPRSADASSSNLSHETTSNGLDVLQHDDRPSSSTRVLVSQPPTSSSNVMNSRTSSAIRRGDARRRRSPLNSGLWISIELVLTVSQIVASIIVLALSRNEHPRTPLFVWIVGYASGCVTTLPLLTSDVGDQHTATTSPRGGQNTVVTSARVKALVDYFKMALDCFFAVWFVIGNVWIFGGHSSASEAPNMYRLCIVFLTFSCIGYAMPFIICATICCCLPCIMSVLGFREDLSQTRGATSESINALPTYKLKSKKSRNDGREVNSGAGEGEVVAAGTEKERIISGEDAICCICLAKYANNDELRELPCSHFMHKECVDKWLKINASCPLCKSEVGENLRDTISCTSATILSSLSGANNNQRRACPQLKLYVYPTYESLQHQIPINTPIGQMGFVSNDLGSQFASVPTPQGGNTECQTYNQLPQQLQSGKTESQTYNQLPQQQQVGNTESQTYNQLPQQLQAGNIRSQTYNQLPQQQQGGNIGSQTYTQLTQQQQGGNIGSQTYTQLTQQQQGGNIGSQTYTQLPQQQQGGNIDSQTFTQLPQQQQGGNIGSETYTQRPQHLLMSDKPVGEIIPTKLDSPRQHQLPTLKKRKAPMEPISPNSIPQTLSFPNKRVFPIHLDHSLPQHQTRKQFQINLGQQLQEISLHKGGPLPKVQKESFESVRSKMRENLTGALAMVSQKQGENAMVEKKSNGEAVGSPGKREDVSHTANLSSGNSDSVCAIPAELQGTLLSNLGGSADGNNDAASQTLQYDGQQLQKSDRLPDEDVPFSDNIFAGDELLQGNGLSWVLAPEIDVAKEKEFEIDGKQIPDNEKKGKDDLEQSLPSPQELAYQIEAELFKLFGGVNKKYKENGRSLLFNLKDHNNPELRERVMTDEIPPELLCSMSAEELASKELSQWRQAKAEELAQMVVLPDVEVDVRRLVRKTHKGEVQVEVEQIDNESDAAGKRNNPEDPNLTITIPSSEGPDPIQGLMGEDELKDADILPPIVSLDEFMQSLDSEPPFENLPGDAHPLLIRMTQKLGLTQSLLGERVWEGMLQLNISSMTSVICIFKSGEKTTTKDWPSLLDIKGRVRPDAFEKFLQELPMSRSLQELPYRGKSHLWNIDKLWGNLLSLNVKIEKTKEMELEQYSSFDLNKKHGEQGNRFKEQNVANIVQIHFPWQVKRSVVHVVCKEGSTESESGSLVEAADSYILDGRLGFAEASPGVEIYFCPPHAKTLERLTNILSMDQLQALKAVDNGLIGVVVWRRAQLISPNSTSHHKYTSKKQHFTPTPVRPHEKEDAITNMNTNFPPKPTSVSATHVGPPLHSVPLPPDDDNVPPGFGPAASRYECDLPEFNFSGDSNPYGPKYPTGYQSQRVGMASSHLHRVSMRQWDDDDDDIPEWQPLTSQQHHLQPPHGKVRRFQQPMQAPHQLPHQTLPAMHVQGQHGNRWVPPPGSPSPGQPSVNGPKIYGTTVGTRQPAWRKDAPHSRGF